MSDTGYLALDVGEKRVGIAWADGGLRIPFPLTTLPMDEQLIPALKKLMDQQNAGTIVVGLPRNQSGAETAQSGYARDFATKLKTEGLKVVLQDESLTSVLAEDELKARGKPYQKEDIDSLAATLILQDYLAGVAA